MIALTERLSSIALYSSSSSATGFRLAFALALASTLAYTFALGLALVSFSMTYDISSGVLFLLRKAEIGPLSY
jgi:hypothetical protein